MKTYKLAADSNDGIYEVMFIEPGATVYLGGEFRKAIETETDITVFGIVDEDDLNELKIVHGVVEIGCVQHPYSAA